MRTLALGNLLPPLLVVSHRGPDHRGNGADADRAPERDLAAMRAHNLPHDREAEARTLAALLGRKVRIEDGVEVMGRDAVAAVGDLDAQTLRARAVAPVV